jgi:chemotaxis methyl-accepting protein methylase
MILQTCPSLSQHRIVPNQTNVLAPAKDFSLTPSTVATQTFGSNDRFAQLAKSTIRVHMDGDLLLGVISSTWFRRGSSYGSGSDAYQDVIDTLKQVLKTPNTPKVLAVGVANGEEPFSILSTTAHLTKQKPLEEVLDLHCVDLRSKLPNHFIDKKVSPDLNNNRYIEKFAPTSFDSELRLDSQGKPFSDYYRCDGALAKRYVVKPHILEYLKKVFNDCDTTNPQAKTHWNTHIVDFAKKSDDATYDLISFNNVAVYLNKEEFADAYSNLCRMIKPGGFIITDPYGDEQYKTMDCFKEFTKFRDGIWQRKMKPRNQTLPVQANSTSGPHETGWKKLKASIGAFVSKYF